MKKIIVLLLACLFMLLGCAEAPPSFETTIGDRPTETSTIKWQPTDTETELETEPEETEPEVEDPYFGLSEFEIKCIVEKLNSWNIQCNGASDFKNITCLGYGLRYTAPGVGNCELNYDIIEYGVSLKNGRAFQVWLSSEVLAEHGIDVAERGANRKLSN